MDFKPITTLMASNYFAIPDYQRDYSWTDQQNMTLFEDLANLVRDRGIESHFLGALVTTPYEQGTGSSSSIDFNDYGINPSNVKHVVDGQQRLTSISILIKAVLECKERDIPNSGELKWLAQSLEGCLYGGQLYNNMPAPKLILNGNTGRYYQKQILNVWASEKPNGRLQGAKRVQKAYDLFMREIGRLKVDLIAEGVVENALEFYKALIVTVMEKVQFVEVECSSSTNAFQVFDSLNGKGLDLTAADRIKNIFMSWSPVDKRTQKWDSLALTVGEDNLVRFFSCLMFYQARKRVSKRRLPDVFSRVYKEAALSDYDDFYRRLQDAAKAFGSLKHKMTGIEKLDKELLLDLDDLKQDQVLVPLTAVLIHYGQDDIKDTELISFVEKLTSLLVRLQVCQITTNRLDAIFSDCIKKMRDENLSLKGLTEFVVKKQRDTVSDEMFTSAFASFTTSDTKVAKYYLGKLESKMREKAGNRAPISRMDTNASKLTVEHIIPQSIDELEPWYGVDHVAEDVKESFKETVIQSLGNMALLYQDDNSSAGNNSYQAKLSVYRNGSANQTKGTPEITFRLIGDLIERYPERFTHEEVADRARRMADLAASIWV